MSYVIFVCLAWTFIISPVLLLALIAYKVYFTVEIDGRPEWLYNLLFKNRG